MERILVGMSGGIDSFVTALCLKEEGYEVTGVVLDLWKQNDLYRLVEICRKLNIGFLHWEGRERFRKKIVHPFISQYLSGETPSPCCLCNREIKWKLLLQIADKLGIEKVATGHYVRIAQREGYRYIRKGIDPNKDQSYFLWGLPQAVLTRAVTPLGEKTKAEVKAYALANGYPEIARQRESMGICFLEGQDYREFICRESGRKQKGGEILDRQGRSIGEHKGILNYTIGQKRGMPVKEGRPLYVAEIKAEENVIVADVKEGLYTRLLELQGVEYARQEDLSASDLEVKVRGLGLNPEGFAKIRQEGEDRWLIELDSPAWAVAPGQSVAFYRGDWLVGGGIVRK